MAMFATLLATAQPPANDDCQNATVLPVNALIDCPSNTVSGDNSMATFAVGEPYCDPGGTYQDVWYTFNSGIHDTVEIDLQIGTIQDWGLEVLDACDTAGTTVACGIYPQLHYVVQVIPGRQYWVRLFTNLDFDLPGTFGICISASDPPPLCEGSTVKTDQDEDFVITCPDGSPDLITLVNYSTGLSPYIYVLMDQDDVTVWPITGDTFDADTLAPGVYHIHGVSFDGLLIGAVPGRPITDIGSDGQCYDLSDNYVELDVEICTGISSSAPVALSAMLTSERTALLLRGAGPIGDARVDLFDLQGRIVASWQVRGSATERSLPLPSACADAPYVVRMTLLDGGTPFRATVR